MACPPSQGLFSPSHPFCPIERIVSDCLPTRLPMLDGGFAFPTCCLPFLSPIVPTCVPVLDGVSAFPRSCLPLSPIVSPQFAFVLDGVSAFPRSCLPCRLPLSPISLLVSLSWMVRPPFRGLVSPGPPLLPILSHCLPSCVHLCWMVCPSWSLSSYCLPWSLEMVCPPSRRLVSELSPIVPTFVPVLDGVSALPRSCPPLSPFLSILVSGCLHVSLDMCACIGWCVRLLDVLSPRVSHCLPLSPQRSSIVSPHVCLCWTAFRGLVCPLTPINSPHWCLCWMVSPPWIISYPPSRGLVSHCLPTRVPVLDVVPAFPRSCVLDGASTFSRSCLPLVSHCLPFFACVGWCVRLPEVLSPLSPSLSSFRSKAHFGRLFGSLRPTFFMLTSGLTPWGTDF